MKNYSMNYLKHLKIWILKKMFKNEIQEFEKIIIAKDTQINNLKQRINFITISKGL